MPSGSSSQPAVMASTAHANHTTISKCTQQVLHIKPHMAPHWPWQRISSLGLPPRAAQTTHGESLGTALARHGDKQAPTPFSAPPSLCAHATAAAVSQRGQVTPDATNRPQETVAASQRQVLGHSAAPGLGMKCRHAQAFWEMPFWYCLARLGSRRSSRPGCVRASRQAESVAASRSSSSARLRFSTI